MHSLYIYEADAIEFRCMDPYGMEDLDCILTDEEYAFIQHHRKQHEKYQTMLEEIFYRHPERH